MSAPRFSGVSYWGSSSQKGLSPCPRKPIFHTVGVVFCRSMASCHRAPELFRVQAEFGLQFRVSLHEHFGPQRLGVVVGDDQPHIGGKVMVAVAVFAVPGMTRLPPKRSSVSNTMAKARSLRRSTFQ